MKKINLIRRFSFLSLISMLVFGYAFGTLLGNAMEKSMFNKSVVETADIVLANVVKHFKPKHLRDPKTGRKYEKFQHKMDHLSLGKDIVKATIWNQDRIVVWDQNEEKVNKGPQSQEISEDLAEAFHGGVFAEVHSSRELLQNSHMDIKSKQLLELYVPIKYKPDGPVVNVFEVHQDFDPLYAAIAHHKHTIWLWTIAGFSSFYFVLFWGFWDASSRINRQARENEQLQEQVMQSQKMESVGRLAGGVAHDFNNILSVIIGFSEMTLKELPEGTTVKDNIQTIHGAGERAAALTRQLLAFSRKQVLEVQATKIHSVIGNMMKMLKRLVPANVTFEFNSQLQDQMILADTAQLEQILLNLVVNARDAMPGGGSLTIKTEEERIDKKSAMGNENIEPGLYILLSVTDTGTGMKQEVIEKIFEPFFTTKGVGKGTGMGLSTVFGVVKQHKGHIVVNSELNKGTSFIIYFPVAEGVTEAAVVDTPERELTGNETILLVDDESMILKVFGNMLKSMGYHILEAKSGEEALQVSQDFKEKIDLLLTDVVMPGMNGRELADTLKAERHEIKVIFMSGYTDDVLAHHGVLEEGMVLLQKPLTENVLANKIRDILDVDQESNPVNPEPEDIGELCILLVDDNNDIRMLVKSYLKDSLCKIDTAENGEIAFDTFKSGTYDLVLMDMQMPVMDGVTAVKEMRKWEEEKQREKTMIIALTGNSSQEDIDRCVSAGYNSHLSKPIKKDQLVTTIHKYAPTVPQNNKGDENKCEEASSINNNDHVEKFQARIDQDLKDLVPGYIDCRRDDVKNLQGALEKGDFETIQSLGHSMKGSGGGYGFQDITDIGRNIESAAKEQNHEEAKDWVNKLSDYIDNVEIVYE
jgi:signal transduction histidine kinase/DNA-binding response OmpR family regulator